MSVQKKSNFEMEVPRNWKEVEVTDNLCGDIELVDNSRGQKVEDEIVELDNFRKEADVQRSSSQDGPDSEANNGNGSRWEYFFVFIFIMVFLAIILGAVLYFNDIPIFGVKIRKIG
ncbi:unnamed protein product [Orchesella dallaii]|uniref:Uncharacterized protein n=1 Tax=Orchesella dallaii TaxID=48710 RepID=A0ABP1QDN6_9HEXA